MPRPPTQASPTPTQANPPFIFGKTSFVDEKSPAEFVKTSGFPRVAPLFDRLRARVIHSPARRAAAGVWFLMSSPPPTPPPIRPTQSTRVHTFRKLGTAKRALRYAFKRQPAITELCRAPRRGKSYFPAEFRINNARQPRAKKRSRRKPLPVLHFARAN